MTRSKRKSRRHLNLRAANTVKQTKLDNIIPLFTEGNNSYRKVDK